jgi:hypothetical protein
MHEADPCPVFARTAHEDRFLDGWKRRSFILKQRQKWRDPGVPDDFRRVSLENLSDRAL